MKRISFIFGTRPEAIKLCPLILALRNDGAFETHVCVTGQHREMLDQVLQVFEILPDVDLAMMQPNQSLGSLSARSISAIDGYLEQQKPDMVIVQGDTTTVFCAGLCAFYHRVPVAHIEAGLRTWNKYSPYPEEINRVMVTRLADLHFAPTGSARDNLIRDGVASERIFVTGNTVIDALFAALEKVKANQPIIPGLSKGTMNNGKAMVLITGHRRENFGEGFRSICQAIVTLAGRFPEVSFVYPVHLNPQVRMPVFSLLKGYENIHLIEPLSYLQFVALMNRATLIITDSGGVQEEAPSLGKPVLVTRDTTERPEAVEMGTARLVGTAQGAIVSAVHDLLTNCVSYQSMASASNPYGDGHACGRIVKILRHAFVHNHL